MEYEGTDKLLVVDRMYDEFQYRDRKDISIELVENKSTNSDGEITFYDTIKLKIDKEIEDYAKREYDKFKSKCKMFGIDMSFKYYIIGNDIIYKEYTGTESKVIVPDFITIIASRGLNKVGIKGIKLGKRVRDIGLYGICLDYGDDFKYHKNIKHIYKDSIHIGMSIDAVMNRDVNIDYNVQGIEGIKVLKCESYVEF